MLNGPRDVGQPYGCAGAVRSHDSGHFGTGLVLGVTEEDDEAFCTDLVLAGKVTPEDDATAHLELSLCVFSGYKWCFCVGSVDGDCSVCSCSVMFKTRFSSSVVTKGSSSSRRTGFHRVAFAPESANGEYLVIVSTGGWS